MQDKCQNFEILFKGKNLCVSKDEFNINCILEAEKDNEINIGYHKHNEEEFVQLYTNDSLLRVHIKYYFSKTPIITYIREMSEKVYDNQKVPIDTLIAKINSTEPKPIISRIDLDDIIISIKNLVTKLNI